MKKQKENENILSRHFTQLILWLRKITKSLMEHKDKIWMCFSRIGKILQVLAWLGTFTVAIISVCQYKRIGEDYIRKNRPYVYVGGHKSLKINLVVRDSIVVSGKYTVWCKGEVPGYDVIIRDTVNNDKSGDLNLMPNKPHDPSPRWLAPNDYTERKLLPPMIIPDSSYFHIYIWYSSPLNIEYRYHRVFLMTHSGKISMDINAD